MSCTRPGRYIRRTFFEISSDDDVEGKDGINKAGGRGKTKTATLYYCRVGVHIIFERQYGTLQSVMRRRKRIEVKGETTDEVQLFFFN